MTTSRIKYYSICIVMALLMTGDQVARAQEASLPAINLGDTSFLDGIAFPGWLVEEIGQGVHDNKTFDGNGQPLPQVTDINSGASLTHIAWISHAKLLGAWYGAEVVFSAAYVDTGGHGTGYGFGAVTLGPMILQWPELQFWHMRIYQRAVLDLDAPVGKYSPNATINIGSNAWDIQPYHAFTLYPMKKRLCAGIWQRGRLTGFSTNGVSR